MGVVIVGSRNRREVVSELGMRCDEREIPHPIDGKGDPYRWVGICYFLVATEDASSGQAAVVKYEKEPAAIAISNGILFGICGPKSPLSPAPWFTAPLARISVTTTGTLGIIRKRPFKVNIEMEEEGWALVFMSIARIRQSTHRAMHNQEQEFLDAISKSA